jgi:hypothetical protein
MLDFFFQLDFYLFQLINGQWHLGLLDVILPVWRSQYFWAPLYMFFLTFLLYNYQPRTIYVIVASYNTNGLYQRSIERKCHQRVASPPSPLQTARTHRNHSLVSTLREWKKFCFRPCDQSLCHCRLDGQPLKATFSLAVAHPVNMGCFHCLWPSVCRCSFSVRCYLWGDFGHFNRSWYASISPFLHCLSRNSFLIGQITEIMTLPLVKYSTTLLSIR